MTAGVRDFSSALRQQLWIDGALPGMNEVIAAAKGCGGSGALYAKMKKEQTERIAWLAKAAKLRPVQRARFVFAWSERSKRRDPDNFVAARKFVLDGLVVAGVLPGDGWDCVVGFHDTWVSQPERPGVLVVIEDAAV